MVLFTTFVNGRICRGGELVEDQFVASDETGLFLKRTGYIGGEAVDLEDGIVAPGFLELQTNGMLGFHFTQFVDEKQYSGELEKVSKHLVTKGVTGFWATVPTVAEAVYKKVNASYLNLGLISIEGTSSALAAVPISSGHAWPIAISLWQRPCDFVDSASLLGAHVEGPYLQSTMKGAHNASLFRLPTDTSPFAMYGEANLYSSIKLVTVAPELPGSSNLISQLANQDCKQASRRHDIRVSLGHSSATYEEGLLALSSGASAITHAFNAMSPFHHRKPGLAGLISRPQSSPYYSVIADGIHLHPVSLNLAYRANPAKCMLISDSVELSGLPDGTYPGNAQISGNQIKSGNQVVIEGTDTLIGSCCSLDECVRNLMKWSGCSVAEAVRCVTENVAEMMGLQDRGKIEEGRRADFVVLNDDGEVLQTWVAGKKVWERV